MGNASKMASYVDWYGEGYPGLVHQSETIGRKFANSTLGVTVNGSVRKSESAMLTPWLLAASMIYCTLLGHVSHILARYVPQIHAMYTCCIFRCYEIQSCTLDDCLAHTVLDIAICSCSRSRSRQTFHRRLCSHEPVPFMASRQPHSTGEKAYLQYKSS